MFAVKNFARISRFLARAETALICLGFVLSLGVFVFIALKTAPMTGDSSRYLALADSLRQGVFGLQTENGFEPEGVRSFGYPLFIIVCQMLFGKSLSVIVIVQGFLYLISIFLIWRLVKENFGTAVSLIFLSLTTAYPFIAYSSALISPENATIFLLALAAYTLNLFYRKGHFYKSFALTGFLLGISVYFRSNLLPLPFFLAAFFLLFDNRKWKPISALALTAFLSLLPAIVYNYYFFNRLTPAPVYGGAATSLWMATWRARVSTDTFLKYSRDSETTPDFAASGMFEQVAETNRKAGVANDYLPFNMGYFPNNETRGKIQEEYGKAAIENIKSAPLTYLQTCFMNVFRMWFSFHLPENFSFLLRFLLISIGVLAFLGGLAGIIIAAKDSVHLFSPFVIFALGTILLHAFSLCWLHIEARYTIPARFFLLAFASLAIFHIFKSIEKIFEKKSTK